MTAFTLPPIFKKLMRFGNVQVRENSRAGGLKDQIYDQIILLMHITTDPYTAVRWIIEN